MYYSLDLRNKVIKFIEEGNSITLASKIFDMARSTIHKWLNRKKLTGNLERLPRGGGFKSKVNAKKFKEYINDNPDKTLKEIGNYFGISSEGASYNLKKHGYVYKKNTSLPRKKRRVKKEVSN